ncbi:prolyl oligopeptidase family serine peptidase [Sphingobium subterraneum]|uniref:prolyl oligopeptidase n=1 Tax=Sphingobium subterraneum TaxID=627688 RepID=A0A841J1G9_9SPHN|nr:prolyl oligopeptidase family serine peptidase [Sphingobium subterraneum]MBB6125019.1 prolyl oligopeptidase [Sphingobium subterraneum]
MRKIADPWPMMAAGLRALSGLMVVALAAAAVPAFGAPDGDVSLLPQTASIATRSAPPMPLAYPTTRAVDLVEQKFGVAVADPYRWLENDVRVDSDVAAWVREQNRVTDAYLAGLPGRNIFQQRMKQLYDYGRYSTPRKGGSRYFYSYNSGLQNQSPLYVRDGLKGAQRLLLDPNSLSKDGATALAEWEPSPDGAFLVYAVQEGGSDWRTLQVIDVTSGRTLSDRIEWVKFSRLAWDAQGLGFFYSRFPAPPRDKAFQSPNENQAIWYHRIGTDQSADRLVYATSSRPKLGHSAEVTDDGAWLVITSSEGTDERFELTVVDLTRLDWANPRWKPRTLVRGLEHDWKLVGGRGNRLWFVTDKGAPRGRMVTLDAAKPRRAPVEIVPERPDTLAAGSMVGDRIILAYMSDARTVAVLVESDGRWVGDVPLPDIGTAAGFGGKAGDPETFFSFSSYTTPSTVYRYDTATNRISLFAQPKLAFDPDDYLTQQIFYPSKDGTQVPMFIVRRKDLAISAKAAPTLLYGYGGFNIPVTPAFSAAKLAWVEQGGVLAVANLRGGGEYGKEWHDGGRLANKQNVFDDFIAAGEYLMANGYTGSGQLAIEGRSNGGLLVGAVVNQRPDLFAAALPAVGVMDMLRFDQFTAGRYWVDDYGYPDREEDFRRLLAYSPYHNIHSGTDYPAILVSTADTDDRVVPGHSFKYTAALQAARIGPKPHLIRIETRAGHGSGKPTDKLISEYADYYAFAARWTGMELKAPPPPHSVRPD